MEEGLLVFWILHRLPLPCLVHSRKFSQWFHEGIPYNGSEYFKELGEMYVCVWLGCMCSKLLMWQWRTTSISGCWFSTSTIVPKDLSQVVRLVQECALIDPLVYSRGFSLHRKCLVPTMTKLPLQNDLPQACLHKCFETEQFLKRFSSLTIHYKTYLIVGSGGTCCEFPHLGVDCCEFKASLAYILSSSPARNFPFILDH